MSVLEKFQMYFVDALGVLRINANVIEKTSKDRKALPYAIWILLLPSIFNFALSALAFRSLVLLDFIFLLKAVSALVTIVLVALVAKFLFRSNIKVGGFVVPAAMLHVVEWILIIPFALNVLGGFPASWLQFLYLLAEMWTLYLIFVLLRMLGGLSSFKAFLTILLVILGLSILQNYALELLLGKEAYDELFNSLLS